MNGCIQNQQMCLDHSDMSVSNDSRLSNCGTITSVTSCGPDERYHSTGPEKKSESSKQRKKCNDYLKTTSKRNISEFQNNNSCNDSCAVNAWIVLILDVFGFSLLGIDRFYCGQGTFGIIALSAFMGMIGIWIFWSWILSQLPSVVDVNFFPEPVAKYVLYSTLGPSLIILTTFLAMLYLINIIAIIVTLASGSKTCFAYPGVTFSTTI